MKVLLGCVNSAVSLVGYDTKTHTPFWYCPGNVLRVCGICTDEHSLWVASDNMLSRLGTDGVVHKNLPGPMDNLAHSVKALSQDMLAIVDTGNSRVLLYNKESDIILSSSPLQGWEASEIPLPHDAIHCNDILAWREGFLLSAFSHQPFREVQKHCPSWKKEGLGLIYYMRRKGGKTVTSVVASGLNCPHSLVEHAGSIYCCSSSTGDFYRLVPANNGGLNFDCAWKVTDSHFLRGALRVEDGWLLGGSSRREQSADDGGMVLFHLNDAGMVTKYNVANTGEIYDIIPWNANIMQGVARQCLELPTIDLPGSFPARCGLETLK